MDTLEVVPSYGRDYKTKKEVKAAWDEGKDFTIMSFGPDYGRQINKQDAKPGMVIMIRFAKQTKLEVVNVK